MISHGWKVFGEYVHAGAGGSANISEQSQLLTGSFVLECTGYSWALCSLYTSVSTLSTLEIWGTQGDAESGQKNKTYVSYNLCTTATDAIPAAAYSVNSGVFGLSTNMANYQIASVTQVGNGVADSPGLLGVFYNIAGWRGLQADNTATTGETNNAGPYYANFGDSAGPAWIAIPCGPFDYLQFKVAVGAACTSAVVANTLV